MNQSTAMTQVADAIRADVNEIVGCATDAEFGEVLQSASSALATRLLVAADVRGARIEQLIVAIKQALGRIVRPAHITEITWDAIAQKLVSDCIAAHFAAAQEQTSPASDPRGRPA